MPSIHYGLREQRVPVSCLVSLNDIQDLTTDQVKMATETRDVKNRVEVY